MSIIQVREEKMRERAERLLGPFTKQMIRPLRTDISAQKWAESVPEIEAVLGSVAVNGRSLRRHEPVENFFQLLLDQAIDLGGDAIIAPTLTVETLRGEHIYSLESIMQVAGLRLSFPDGSNRPRFADYRVTLSGLAVRSTAGVEQIPGRRLDVNDGQQLTDHISGGPNFSC